MRLRWRPKTDPFSGHFVIHSTPPAAHPWRRDRDPLHGAHEWISTVTARSCPCSSCEVGPRPSLSVGSPSRDGDRSRGWRDIGRLACWPRAQTRGANGCIARGGGCRAGRGAAALASSCHVATAAEPAAPSPDPVVVGRSRGELHGAYHVRGAYRGGSLSRRRAARGRGSLYPPRSGSVQRRR